MSKFLTMNLKKNIYKLILKNMDQFNLQKIEIILLSLIMKIKKAFQNA